MVGEVERHTSIAFAQRLEPGPGDLAGGDQAIEVGRRVVLEPRRQHVALERRGHQRRPLQLLDRVEQRVEATPLPCDALPRADESAERVGFDRFDLFPQPRERSLPQRPQHVGAAPFSLDAARRELALEDAPRRRQARERLLRRRQRQAEPGGARLRGERSMRAGVALDEIADGIAYRRQQRLGQARRQRRADSVPVARGVLDRNETRLARDRHDNRAPCAHQPIGVVQQRRRCQSRQQLPSRQVAEPQQQIVDPVGAARAMRVVEPLKLPLQRLQHLRVEQLAQLGIAKQIAQLGVIDAQRVRAALGQRRVAVVEERRDITEKQRGGKWRRQTGVHADHANLPA